MSAYEELLTRCVLADAEAHPATKRDKISAILAEVLRTLEMWAGSNSTVYDEATLLTMLHSCPLSPP